MGLTDDPTDPRISRGVDSNPRGQQEVYLVLSEDERSKGFVAPLRFAYIHVGERRNTVGEKSGRACNALTSMNHAIAQTYARQPTFYGATYCVACSMHLPVGSEDSGGEFVWANDAGMAEQPHWYVGTLPPEEPCSECGRVGGFDGHVCEETSGYVAETRDSLWTPEAGPEPTKLWTPDPPKEGPTLAELLDLPESEAGRIVKGPWSEGAEQRRSVAFRKMLWKHDPQILSLIERVTVAVSGDGPLESQVRRWWTLVAVAGIVGALAGLGIGLWLT